MPLLEQGQGDGDGAAMVKGAVEDRTADDDAGGATTMRQAGREGWSEEYGEGIRRIGKRRARGRGKVRRRRNK